ncbi:MAG: ATP-binding protein, partial [Bacteroidales bacterium]|jgi:signal transduction histidine kinase|nr:ATP-binding protein [Bacteroidales bacterium]
MILLSRTDSTDEVFSELTAELKIKEDDLGKDRKLFERIFKSRRTDQLISSSEILEKLNKIERSEKVIEQSLLMKETELTATSHLLNEAFISLMEQLESYEREKAHEHYKNAEKLAEIAYNRLALFSLIGLILSVFVLFVIIKYIRKSKEYNEILINSKIEAENLAKSKELFMAKVSHEIRTPLNAISGFIKQALSMPMEQPIKEKIKIVDQASDHLIRLINDVLDFTKLRSDQLMLYKSHFDPNFVVKNVCDLFYDLAKKNGNSIIFRIENDENIVLFGDVHRLQQIIYNLLSNAVKFTEHGTIDVFTKVTTENQKSVLFQLIVTDSGSGIDSAMIDAVFQEYTQEDQEVAIKYGGSGLGLTIVKRIVELFNGDIRLESKKGSGTKVICNLRFERGSREDIIERKVEGAKYVFPNNLRVLLADDEEYNRLLITSILDKWKINYDIAKNGLEAIELIKKTAYNFVFMDIRMPIINGVMATKFIRETLSLSSKQTRVIGITADISKNLAEETKNLFNAILTKPFTEDQLYDILKSTQDDYTDNMNKMTSDYQKENLKEADLSNLIRTAANDLGFIEEMIQKFKQSTDNGIKEIEAALENNQYNLIADIAHKLTPASRHLGIIKLVMEFKDIEENAKNENKNVILELVLKAKESLAKAIISLEDQFSELKNKK